MTRWKDGQSTIIFISQISSRDLCYRNSEEITCSLYFLCSELLRQNQNVIRLVNPKLHSIVSNKEILKVEKIYVITGKEIQELRKKR